MSAESLPVRPAPSCPGMRQACRPWLPPTCLPVRAPPLSRPFPHHSTRWLVGPLHLAYRELGGVRGVVSLLQAALASRPAVKEIPRDAEATEAASIAVRLCPLVFLILRWG